MGGNSGWVFQALPTQQRQLAYHRTQYSNIPWHLFGAKHKAFGLGKTLLHRKAV